MALACGQRLDVAGAIAERVGPLARRIHRQRAVSAGSAALDRPGLGRAMIDVARRELAGRAKGRVFLDRARKRCRAVGDHRRVIGAADRKRNGLRRRCAVSVGHYDRETV